MAPKVNAAAGCRQTPAAPVDERDEIVGNRREKAAAALICPAMRSESSKNNASGTPAVAKAIKLGVSLVAG